MGRKTDVWFERARQYFIYSFDHPFGFIIREYILLSCFGLRLPTSWRGHIVKTILYRIYQVIVIFMVITYTGTLSVDLYLVRDDFEKMADNLCLVAGLWLVICKVFFYMINSERNHKVYMILQDLCIAEDINEYTELRDKYILFECLVVVNFRITCNLLVAGFVLSKSPEDPTPMRAWFPFEIDYSPMREILSVYQSLSLFYATNSVHMTETVGVCSWHHIALQFNVLSEQFRDLEKYVLEHVGENGDVDEMYDKRLNVLIMRHQYLIKLSSALNAIYNNQSSAQILFSNLMTCLSALGMSLSLDSNNQKQFFTFVVFLMIAVTQLFVWSLYGQLVINNTEKISDSAYKCIWYERKTSFIKKIIMVILNSQTPIYLQAGLFVFSFDTFVNVLKNSYSCFTLLNSINE